MGSSDERRSDNVELRLVVRDALHGFVNPSVNLDEATEAVLDTLGIRETCWTCGHTKRHDNHVPFKGSDWHDYKPVLVVHSGRRPNDG